MDFQSQFTKILRGEYFMTLPDKTWVHFFKILISQEPSLGWATPHMPFPHILNSLEPFRTGVHCFSTEHNCLWTSSALVWLFQSLFTKKEKIHKSGRVIISPYYKTNSNIHRNILFIVRTKIAPSYSRQQDNRYHLSSFFLNILKSQRTCKFKYSIECYCNGIILVQSISKMDYCFFSIFPLL